MTPTNHFDAIIIGGSYSGLSAAMALGRSLRTVLIIDGGKPCNAQTPHSHNFITHDGERPAVIAQNAKEQVLKYDTVQFLNDKAIKGRKIEHGFEIVTESGQSFSAKKLIFATGVKDSMPEIKGVAECWGISIVHCPYCHGYEIRGQKTGIMANGERGFHITSLVNNLTDQITLLTNGKADFSTEQLVKLDSHNISIIETEIVEIIHENGNVNEVVFTDRTKLDFQAIYAVLPFAQHSHIPERLGCELTETGHISVNQFQQTTIEGIYACGDNSSPMRSVAFSVATGNIAGAMVNMDLTSENF